MTAGERDGVPRIVVSADIDTPDRIAWGLSFRQLAVLAVPAGAWWVAYGRFGPLLPPGVWVVGGIVVLAVAVVVALGRRDGLPLEVWVRHGLASWAVPAVAAPGARGGGPAVVEVRPRLRVPAPLSGEVTSIGADGLLTVASTVRSVIACGTTSIALRTGPEQAGLLEGSGGG